MLAIAAGTFIFSTAMTPVQIFVLCLVVTYYIPCLATFGVIARDLVRGGLCASGSSPSFVALIAGGIAFRVLTYAHSIKKEAGRLRKQAAQTELENQRPQRC